MKASQILDAAADKIERDGWWQGRMYGPNGTCCAWGAMTRIARGLDDWWDIEAIPGYVELRAAVGGSVSTWNDTRGRTAAEVIAMLRAVAMTERAREARLMPVVQEPRVFTLHEQVTA